MKLIKKVKHDRPSDGRTDKAECWVACTENRKIVKKYRQIARHTYRHTKSKGDEDQDKEQVNRETDRQTDTLRGGDVTRHRMKEKKKQKTNSKTDEQKEKKEDRRSLRQRGIKAVLTWLVITETNGSNREMWHTQNNHAKHTTQARAPPHTHSNRT